MSTLGSAGTRRRAPGAVIGMEPAKHFYVAARGGLIAGLLIPGTSVGMKPL